MPSEQQAPWDGYPQDRERDGWHWVLVYGEAQAAKWSSGGDLFGDFYLTGSEEPMAPVEVIPAGWRYLGPCLTPAEVAAKVDAEREACAAWHDARAAEFDREAVTGKMPDGSESGRKSMWAREDARAHRLHAAAIRARKGEPA